MAFGCLTLSPGTCQWGAVSSLKHPCIAALLLPKFGVWSPARGWQSPIVEQAQLQAGVTGCAAGRCHRLCRAVSCGWTGMGSVQQVSCTGCASCVALLLLAVLCCAAPLDTEGMAAAHCAMLYNVFGYPLCHTVPCSPLGHTGHFCCLLCHAMPCNPLGHIGHCCCVQG